MKYCDRCGLDIIAIQAELARLKKERDTLNETLTGQARTIENQDSEMARYMGEISELRLRVAYLLAKKGDDHGDAPT